VAFESEGVPDAEALFSLPDRLLGLVDSITRSGKLSAREIGDVPSLLRCYAEYLEPLGEDEARIGDSSRLAEVKSAELDLYVLFLGESGTWRSGQRDFLRELSPLLYAVWKVSCPGEPLISLKPAAVRGRLGLALDPRGGSVPFRAKKTSR
jgi:hypothetical protein